MRFFCLFLLPLYLAQDLAMDNSLTSILEGYMSQANTTQITPELTQQFSKSVMAFFKGNATNTSFDLYKCVGIAKGIKCQEKVSGCSDLNDEACLCKSVGKVMDQCFPASQLDPKNPFCGEHIFEVRKNALDSALFSCISQRYETDILPNITIVNHTDAQPQQNTATIATSYSWAALVACLLFSLF